jgi:non-ribosomal peptide synthetase component F
MLGCFMNSLPLRVRMGGVRTFRDLLGRVRDVTLGAYANADVSFERLLAEALPRQDGRAGDLFRLRILFALQNTPAPAAELPGLAIRGLVLPKDRMFNDLLFLLHEADGRLRGQLVYNADRYEASTVAGVWEHFAALLQAMVLDPERPLSGLPGGA